jgi:hypothetical protein
MVVVPAKAGTHNHKPLQFELGAKEGNSTYAKS